MANEQNLIPFKKGQCGNPKGRPRNNVPEMVRQIFKSKRKVTALKKCAINKTEAATWENIVFSMPFDDLKVLAQSSSTPTYPKGLAIALITDMKNGTTKTINKLREWQFGKVAQAIELSGQVKGAEPLTIEVIDRREQVEPTEEL